MHPHEREDLKNNTFSYNENVIRVLPLFPPRKRAASVADDSPLESVLVASQTAPCSHDMGRKRTQRCKSPDNSKAHQAKVDCSAQAS